MKIPDNITIGGQVIEVKLIDHLDNGYLGQISLEKAKSLLLKILMVVNNIKKVLILLLYMKLYMEF